MATIGDENARIALPPSSNGMEQRMQKRRRYKHTSTLEERLAEDTAQMKEQAKTLTPGPTRDHVMRRIRQNETAADLCLWLDSPGLRPPV